ncbi:MAG: prefoldin subunit alpha [Candidatus Thermoplasmatota archaeon]|nr:prefoldin subunit alpha [Candidatus Thermoplasmatota archaeon]
MDQQELQRVAQLVEMNRQKMARIEEQITRLSEIRLEQLGVIASLKVLATEQPTMIPLGAGVQLPAKPTGDTVVIDIGSGVQAEKPRTEAIEILEGRLSEVDGVMETLQNEFTDTEQIVAELAKTFSEAAKEIQQPSSESAGDQEELNMPTPKRRRKKHGTELTLDD